MHFYKFNQIKNVDRWPNFNQYISSGIGIFNHTILSNSDISFEFDSIFVSGTIMIHEKN